MTVPPMHGPHRWVLVALAGVWTDDGRMVDRYLLPVDEVVLLRETPTADGHAGALPAGAVEVRLTRAGHVLALLPAGVWAGVDTDPARIEPTDDGRVVLRSVRVLALTVHPSRATNPWPVLR